MGPTGTSTPGVGVAVVPRSAGPTLQLVLERGHPISRVHAALATDRAVSEVSGWVTGQWSSRDSYVCRQLFHAIFISDRTRSSCLWHCARRDSGLREAGEVGRWSRLTVVGLPGRRIGIRWRGAQPPVVDSSAGPACCAQGVRVPPGVPEARRALVGNRAEPRAQDRGLVRISPPACASTTGPTAAA